MSYKQPTIEDTKPNTDCKYCVLHHYVESDGKTPCREQYAQCTCPEKTQGFMTIDIVFASNPLEFNTSCQNCENYISKRQLELFLQ